MKFFNKFIGDRAFYKRVLIIAIPIMVQQGITNFVNLLDNIMVGRTGTEQMSGVAIVNQLIMVYNLCIFGGLSGAGIFTAQYFGKNDKKGVRDTFRFKLLMTFIITTLVIILLLFNGEYFINLYLTGDNSGGNIADALLSGKNYLNIILISFPAFMIVQSYSETLRECNETVIPMFGGIAAVFVNLFLNYILIFGKFGFPELGVSGAAIATTISRYVEMIFVVFYVHTHSEKYDYVKGLYRSFKIPVFLVKKIIIKGFPLLVNETVWAASMAALTQCYSLRGLSVVAGMNISNTINNLFNVVFFALGSTVAIIVGQLLGAHKIEEAKDSDNKLIAFSVMASVVTAVLMVIISSPFTELYLVSERSKEIAKIFIILQAVFIPQNAFLHASYFTLRSGGNTFITFLFDSVFITFVSLPIAFVLSRYTDLNVFLIFTIVNIADWIKCIIGYILVKKGIWINTII